MRGELREEKLKWKTKNGTGPSEEIHPGEPGKSKEPQLCFFLKPKFPASHYISKFIDA